MSEDLSIPNPGYRPTQFGRQGRPAAGMDPATRRLMMFAGGLGVVLIGLIGASTLVGHRSSRVPVLTADHRPIRVKPENPGGMQIDGAENDIFSGGPDTTNSKLAPPAETPEPNGMPLETKTTSPATSSGVAPNASPEVTATAPAASARSAPEPAGTSSASANIASGAQTPAAALPAVPAPRIPAPATRAQVAPVSPAPQTLAKGRSAPVAAVSGKASSGHPVMVQLAALGSEQAARDEWQHMVKRMPDLLSSRHPTISRYDRDGRTFWRLRTTGFSDPAQAKQFCSEVRTKGRGCAVADF